MTRDIFERHDIANVMDLRDHDYFNRVDFLVNTEVYKMVTTAASSGVGVIFLMRGAYIPAVLSFLGTAAAGALDFYSKRRLRQAGKDFDRILEESGY